MKTTRLSTLALVAAALGASALLAACGGSESYEEPVAIEDPNQMPSSATSSTQGLFKFASALAPSDSTEALLLSNVSELPTSETEEPVPLAQ